MLGWSTMIPQALIKDLMSPAVATVSPDATVAEVVRIMRRRVVSSMVVADGQRRPLGIFTERDAVAAAHRQLNIHHVRVRELMGSPPLTADGGAGFRDAYVKMVEQGVRHLIVVDVDGCVEGLLSEGDFLKSLGPEQLLTIKQVDSVMTRRVVSVAPDDTLETAVQCMAEGRYSCVLVVRDECPLGMLTERDVLGLLEDVVDFGSVSVSRYMSSPVATVTAGEPVVKAERYMEAKQIRRLAVVDDAGRIVGLITRHDLVKGVPGVYLEMLRETIERQSHLLQVTRERLDAHLLMDDILSSSMEMAVIATDLDFSILYGNPLVEELLGVPLAELPGRDLRELCRDWGVGVERVHRAQERIAAEEVCNFPMVLESGDEEKYLDIRISGPRDAGGVLRNYVFQALDISTKVVAQRALEYKQRQLDRAMEMARLGSWELDLKTNISVWPGQTRKILGVDVVAPAAPESVLAVLHPDDRERVVQALRDAATGKASYETECRVVREDGSLRYLHTRGELIRDAGGQPVKLSGFVQDVTELRAAEVQMRERAAQYRRLVENAPVIVYRFSSRRGGLYHSARVEQILGHTPDHLRLHPFLWYESIHPEDRPRVDEAIGEVTVGGHFDLEYRIRDASGAWVWLQDRDISIFHGDDETIIEGLATDITQRVRNEQERDALQAQLRQTQKMEALGQLTGGIAHDFNNILASGVGYVELALEQFGDEPSGRLRRYLLGAAKAGRRAEALVDQMLAFSRGMGGELRAMRLQPVIHEILIMLRAALPATLEIDLELAPDVPPVATDPVRFQQILMNLCLNARDAMSGTGRLAIGLSFRHGVDVVSAADAQRVTGDWVALSVRDSGQGIQKEILPHIFEPFFTTKGPGMGSGMGLSVVFGIVQEHRGHILVHSELGTGTCVEVLLPPAPGEGVSQIIAPGGRDETPIANILVVDGEASVAGFLQEILAQWGYRVNAFIDRRAAAEALKSAVEVFDLVIMGQAEPGDGGADLREQLVNLRPDLPILVMGSGSETANQGNADSPRFTGYLPKPVRLEVLKTHLDLLLGSATKAPQVRGGDRKDIECD